MNADQNVIKLRHQALYEVAKLAYAGRLEDEYQFIPERVLPGPRPTTRCCVYREREIFRERIRLSMGYSPLEHDNGNIVQVLEPACADCPISGYLVTELCQNCVGKPCINTCKFGAIHEGNNRSEIDRQKCKECGMCSRVCPYGAIMHLRRPCKTACPVNAINYNEYGLAEIDADKCINCGQCIHRCPFGAIGTKNHIVPIINAIMSGRHVYAMLAPATEGQYGKDITVESWRQAAKRLGFTDLYEVALGADLTTAAEAMEWYEAYLNGESRTTSCCPAFVNFINKHYPELSHLVSTSVSPMCQLSRMIKSQDPDGVTVFIGPCIAKKSEVQDQKIEGNADYALIYSEFEAMMRARGVEFEPCEETVQQGSIYGKRYANAGGVTDSCVQYLREQGIDADLKVLKVSGVGEIKKVLDAAKKDQLMAQFQAQFVEGMCCEGGCFNGPSSRDNSAKAKRARDEALGRADDRLITDNLRSVDRSAFSSHR